MGLFHSSFITHILQPKSTSYQTEKSPKFPMEIPSNSWMENSPFMYYLRLPPLSAKFDLRYLYAYNTHTTGIFRECLCTKTDRRSISTTCLFLVESSRTGQKTRNHIRFKRWSSLCLH